MGGWHERKVAHASAGMGMQAGGRGGGRVDARRDRRRVLPQRYRGSAKNAATKCKYMQVLNQNFSLFFGG